MVIPVGLVIVPIVGVTLVPPLYAVTTHVVDSAVGMLPLLSHGNVWFSLLKTIVIASCPALPVAPVLPCLEHDQENQALKDLKAIIIRIVKIQTQAIKELLI